MQSLNNYFKKFLIAVVLSSRLIAHDLVDLEKINPNIQLDIRYATTNNFTGKKIYAQPKCYVLKEVAQALDHIQKELAKKKLGLKIWDGYRPLPAQEKLWKLVPDPRYVSDPKKGGRHTRGTAVDVTLIRLADSKELDMGTGFDDFSAKDHRNYKNFPEEVLKNRQLLETIMRKYGFTGMASEWWHFDFKNWKNQKPLEIDFEDLE